jgi:hypothetical protein
MQYGEPAKGGRCRWGVWGFTPREVALLEQRTIPVCSLVRWSQR